MLAFMNTLLVARMLNPSDYGVMALAQIWIAMVILIAEGGLGAAIIKFSYLDEKELNAVFWLTMVLAGMGYLVLFAAAPAIAVWFSIPRLADILRVVGLVLPLTAVRLVPDGLLRKQIALDKISQAEIITALLTIPLVFGLAWNGFGVWALVAGALMMSLGHSVLSFWFMPWWPGLRIGGKQLREVLHFSMSTLGAKVCRAASQKMDIFVLGKVSGDVASGLFSMAKDLAMLPAEKLVPMINQLVFPVMAEVQDDQKALHASFFRAIRLISCIVLPFSVGLLLVAEDLVSVVLTDKWMGIVPILQLLCLYAGIFSLTQLCHPVLLILNRAKYLFRFNLVLLCVMPLLFYVGAEWFGAIGVAAAWVAAYPVFCIFLVRVMFQELGIGWRVVLAQIAPSLYATIVMAACVLLAQYGWIWWGIDFVIGRFVATVLLGAVAYSAMVFLQPGQLRGELMEVAGWILRRKQVMVVAK